MYCSSFFLVCFLKLRLGFVLGNLGKVHLCEILTQFQDRINNRIIKTTSQPAVAASLRYKLSVGGGQGKIHEECTVREFVFEIK